MLERARRAGWMLLGGAVLSMLVFRFGPVIWHPWPAILGGAAGILGMLSILNVALVRSLYRQLQDAPPAVDDAAADDAEGGVAADSARI